MSALGWIPDRPLFPFVSSEVETPGSLAPSPRGISTSLDANGSGWAHVHFRSFPAIVLKSAADDINGVGSGRHKLVMLAAAMASLFQHPWPGLASGAAPKETADDGP